METIENHFSGCPAINQLIESSKTLDDDESVQERNRLEWIPYSEFTDIESIGHSNDNQPAYYATHVQVNDDYTPSYKLVEMLLLGTRDECTREFVHEFARTYSLPTRKYDNPLNINQFRRYST